MKISQPVLIIINVTITKYLMLLSNVKKALL